MRQVERQKSGRQSKKIALITTKMQTLKKQDLEILVPTSTMAEMIRGGQMQASFEAVPRLLALHQRLGWTCKDVEDNNLDNNLNNNPDKILDNNLNNNPDDNRDDNLDNNLKNNLDDNI